MPGEFGPPQDDQPSRGVASSTKTRTNSPSPQSVPGLFVTGTGTGVGKSVVAAAIVAALTARARRSPRSSRPSAASTNHPGWPTDHELLRGATGWQTPEQVSPFTFGPPVSPHLAASTAGV